MNIRKGDDLIMAIVIKGQPGLGKVFKIDNETIDKLVKFVAEAKAEAERRNSDEDVYFSNFHPWRFGITRGSTWHLSAQLTDCRISSERDWFILGMITREFGADKPMGGNLPDDPTAVIHWEWAK